MPTRPDQLKEAWHYLDSAVNTLTQVIHQRGRGTAPRVVLASVADAERDELNAVTVVGEILADLPPDADPEAQGFLAGWIARKLANDAVEAGYSRGGLAWLRDGPYSDLIRRLHDDVAAQNQLAILLCAEEGFSAIFPINRKAELGWTAIAFPRWAVLAGLALILLLIALRLAL